MKLVMLQGLPASGKTTYATEVCKEQNWKRVNRDLIRTMLHFGKWSGVNEGLTVDTEKMLARNLLKRDYNVIVDDCNLNPSNKDMWKEVAKDVGAEFSTKKFDTSYEECLARDVGRDGAVGESVIKQMALQYSLPGVPMKDIIICDIDGTIADTTHRLHHLEGDPKNWNAFFAGMVNDPVREDIRSILQSFVDVDRPIVYVSGRPTIYRAFTLEWLKRNDLDLAWGLIMRPDKDSRPDTIVKAEIYDKYFADKEVKLVLDDRPSVIRMWREKGLEVFDVGKGIEF